MAILGSWTVRQIVSTSHHYVFSSIPMEAQKGAVVASVYLGVDVILVVTNLLLSLRGGAAAVARDPALRFVWLSVVLYLVVSLQGSLQALMPVNRFVHFSDWVIGHSHLAMIGFASFAAIGGLLFAWQRVPGFRFSRRAADWSFWLLALGLGFMVLDLTSAGLLQAHLWGSDAPWIESVEASGPFWLVRLFSGFAVLAGFLLLPVAMFTGPVVAAPVAVDAPPAGPGASPSAPAADPLVMTDATWDRGAAAEPRGLTWLRNAYVLTGVAGFGLFLFSFVVLAVWPNEELERRIAETRPAGLPPPTAAASRGRGVYAREGCINCHSQLVRSTAADVRRFGPPGQAWEGEHDYPQMWGTRRVGPDLSRERGRRSRDWQLVHLWNPRAVVPTSNMPPHPWLFDGAPTRPTADAIDLVAYLESLGRDAQLSGLGAPAPPPNMDPEEEMRRGMFCDCAIPRTAGPAPVFSVGTDPGERERAGRRGASAFARNCAGCHGPAGRGDGPAAVALLPKPRNLTTARFSDRAVSRVLWSGVPGSSMPPFADLPAADLRGLVAYVQTLGPPAAGPEQDTPMPAGDREKAGEMFRKNCASCHGADGRGNGRSATTLAPAPTDLALVRPTAGYAEAVLADGVPGTAMPPWKDKLPDAQRVLLARYARSLYRGDE